MSAVTIRLLDRLDELSRHFGDLDAASIARTLASLSRHEFTDADSLLRFHEILLFRRAYPQSAGILRQVERQLASFEERVDRLENSGGDLSPLEHPEASAIAGLAVTDTFSYYIVRWLVQRHPAQIAFDWDWFEDESRLAETWPRFLPLLGEDAIVEANVPYLKWFQAAKGRGHDVSWLIERFESLPLKEKEKAELYNSLKLYVRWTPAFRATRTGMSLSGRRIFYHRKPLIRRKDVSVVAELQAPPAPLRRVSRAQGLKILDLARETSTIRYRELYGFTHGDPTGVLRANIGRGVELFIVGLPPEKRLPLRAYHAALIFKNGVPVGYFEGLSLFERMESGFNFYYTFREGETAWIYAKTLAVLRHLLGVTAFSIDPYQIGYENEEGIESGAFWFYRKLGFRPANPDLLKLAQAEENKIATRSNYRTSPKILRRLATGSMILEMPGTESGEWDRFEVRNLGLTVQRRMAREFGGESATIRRASLRSVMQRIGVKPSAWKSAALDALHNFSLVLALIPDLDRWSRHEKQSVVRVIRAKANADESEYLRLMQKHTRLRAEVIKLGS